MTLELKTTRKMRKGMQNGPKCRSISISCKYLHTLLCVIDLTQTNSLTITKCNYVNGKSRIIQ